MLLSCLYCIPIISVCVCLESPDCGSSLVVHTSVPFGLQHLELDKEEVRPIILEELHKLVPGLPQPTSTKCQKWRYSQVSQVELVQDDFSIVR